MPGTESELTYDADLVLSPEVLSELDLGSCKFFTYYIKVLKEAGKSL